DERAPDHLPSALHWGCHDGCRGREAELLARVRSQAGSLGTSLNLRRWLLLLLFLEIVVVDVAGVDSVLIAVVEVHRCGHVVDLIVPHLDESAALVEIDTAGPAGV